VKIRENPRSDFMAGRVKQGTGECARRWPRAMSYYPSDVVIDIAAKFNLVPIVICPGSPVLQQHFRKRSLAALARSRDECHFPMRKGKILQSAFNVSAQHATILRCVRSMVAVFENLRALRHPKLFLVLVPARLNTTGLSNPAFIECWD
jgi:hypothetical protein